MQVKKDKVKLSWAKVSGATYNIYVRASKSEARKKLNKSALYSNMSEFTKPNFPGNYHISVTSIVNNVESDYSNEAILNVD